MKKNYSLTRMLVLSFLMVLPLAFYAQSTTSGKKDKQETEKKAQKPQESFSPYFFGQGQFGASWSHAEVASTLIFPDLSHDNVFVGTGSLGFGYQFLPWLNAYVGLNRGYAKGYLEANSDKSKYMPIPSHDYWYTSDYYGGDLNLGLNLSNLIGGYKTRAINFGFHAGLGQMQWKSKLYDKTTGSLVARHGYDGNNDSHNGGISNRKVALTIPFGVNVNYTLNDKWDIYGDYSYTWWDTDLLDGVVSGYGNSGRDGTLNASLGIRYKFVPGGVGSMAKKAPEKTSMVVMPKVLEEKGDSVEITVNGTFPPKYFSKNAVMLIQPVIKYEGGEKVLDPIKLKGEKVAGNGELISYQNGGSFTRTYKVPYEKGMDVAQLVTESVVYPYSGKEYASVKDALAGEKKAKSIAERKIADGTIVTAKAVEHNEHFIFAPDGYQKVTIVTNKSELHFKVNQANIDWNLPLNKNKANYDALKNNLSDLYKGWKVKSIDIQGWASPEGEESFNQGLSERRAQAMEKYIKSKIKRELRKKDNNFAFKSVKDIPFNLHANGPDWNGFMKAVEKSDIKDKAAILNVINSANESKKEEEIRNMIQIYPQLEKSILPPLRRAELYVNAIEPKRPESEIAQMATSPDYGQLKVAEILHAANLTSDLNTKKKIYANAMKRYPNCWRAVANAGAVDVELGDYQEAKSLLMKAMKMNKNAAVVRNNMGILYARQGDYKKAEHCFLYAQKLGADEAYNLGIVNIMKGDYAKAVQLLSSKKCSYNLGLAQMLNGNLDAATNTLKCAKENAAVDYLLAVVGARKGDNTMVYNYLAKAIKEDASYKAKAAKDREFLKLFNTPDFKALVGNN
ncbi:hypothetical protein LA303_04870 [Candidatus Sulfidibacterium hydrothermale]|uniref:TPR end-of-group domain-containing protein n=1 Tax=Candidatus Sulfidibacterium hydrothermale TaxID=2875962 RepID=UPI001F0AAD53|nr:hypothetical protein [Candidatus Sulfidibacterium hydrothermale]UBM63308.1 hypothetical protein LA303_04870 [Candidatus Sulfidibacterium hydrothermale]